VVLFWQKRNFDGVLRLLVLRREGDLLGGQPVVQVLLHAPYLVLVHGLRDGLCWCDLRLLTKNRVKARLLST